ncbi:MAG: GGDEF domain-containing protein [Planctomycetota bacterium]|jgi:diguanylate cyclase (GGDEF)-like protein
MYAIPDAQGRRRRAWAYPLSVGLLVLVAWSDWATHQGLSFSIFYLFPICVAVWFGSARWGMGLAFLAACAWFAVDAASPRGPTGLFMPVWNGLVRLGFFAIVAYLLGRLGKALARETRMAGTDALTGALNSRAFYEQARAEISRAARHGRTFSVAYIDLDDFKRLNDSQGHTVGDEALMQVVSVIQNRFRASDLIARLGGDEFVVLLPETGSEGARMAVVGIRRALLDAMVKGGWPVTFSIGVATFEEAPSGVREMLKAADDCMYKAKKAGKNRIRFQRGTSVVFPPGREARPDLVKPLGEPLEFGVHAGWNSIPLLAWAVPGEGEDPDSFSTQYTFPCR